MHEKGKICACQYCGKAFSCTSTLNAHVGNIHETHLRKYKCDKCSFTSVTPSRLRDHDQAVHQKTVQHKCQSCNFSTYRKTCLHSHIRYVHAKHRPHKCDICDMTFFEKRAKLKHMLRHQTTN